MRKFYKTTITVEVLSEDIPIEFDDLNDVNYMIVQGDCSGEITSVETKEISGPETATALIKQGSDPGFFGLTEDGKDLEEETPEAADESI